MKIRLICMVGLSAVISACAIPAPYRAPSSSQSVPESAGSGPVITSPASTPETIPESQPTPPPVVREPTLSPASRALVAQAQAQIAAKNMPLAAATIERALRVEPGNPLLWIELAKVRQAESNYQQAENMARKALSMSINAPRAQSSAWRLIADSYRARGKNVEARDAQSRADALNR
jgi:tetratricopeptide (TPR) repeat protein